MMNISIEVTEGLIEYLDEKVKKGLYKSRSEVVRSAIRMMMKEDIARELREVGLTPEEFRRLKREVGRELVKEMYPEFADDDS